MELQSKAVEQNRLLNQVKANLQYTDRERKRALLVIQELSQLPAETTTYKAVGKWEREKEVG